MKSLLIKNWYFYIIGLSIVFGLKHYYSTASVNNLDWILAPTVWWTKILSGNTFEKVSGIGYVNNANEFIVIASCSGVNYLIILFSTLLYSFMHRWNTFRRKLLWFVLSIVFAYSLTIGINGLRIVFAMHLFNADIYGGVVTQERIHSIEGIVIFFISLFTVFIIADRVVGYFNPRHSRSGKAEQPQKSINSIVKTSMYPFFCYFIMTLGIPVIDSAYKKDIPRFLEHSIVVISICLITIGIYYLLVLLKNKLWDSMQIDSDNLS